MQVCKTWGYRERPRGKVENIQKEERKVREKCRKWDTKTCENAEKCIVEKQNSLKRDCEKCKKRPRSF